MGWSRLTGHRLLAVCGPTLVAHLVSWGRPRRDVGRLFGAAAWQS